MSAPRAQAAPSAHLTPSPIETCKPAQRAAIAHAVREARKQVAIALAALAPGLERKPLKPDVAASLRRNFHAIGDFVIKDVHSAFTIIDRILRTGLLPFRCDDPNNRCAGRWAYAGRGYHPVGGTVVGDKIVGATYELAVEGKIHLCEAFFDPDASVRELGNVVVHECAHVAGRSSTKDEIYQFQRAYQAMSPAEAVKTADAFAMFALEVAYGQSPRVVMGNATAHSTLKGAPLGVRVGVAPPRDDLSADHVRLMLSVSLSGAVSVPQIDFVSPRAKIELSFTPEIGGSRHGVIGEATLGLLLMQPGQQLYVDLGAGVYFNFTGGSEAVPRVLLEAAIGIEAGTFNAGVFWKRYNHLFKDIGNATFIMDFAQGGGQVADG